MMEKLPLPGIALSAACLAVTWIVVSWIASAQRLRDVPGPAWASWTSLWLVRRQLGGCVVSDLAKLTKQYGPIYRIAPNHVVISDPAEVRRVWSARGPWRRGDWYKMFKFDQNDETVLSLQDNAMHAAHRARLQPGYSGKDVDNLHPAIDKHVQSFVGLIERKYLSDATAFRPMDLAEKAQFCTLDIISELAVGQSFNCLGLDHDPHGQMTFVTAAVPMMTTLATIPWSLGLLQNPIVRAMMPQEQLAGVMRMFTMAQKNATKRYGPDRIIVRDMLGSFVEHGLTYKQAWLESFGQIGAGSDTTATAIRMTLFYLISNPDAYTKLQAEVDAAVRDGRVSSPVRDSEAKELPYLQAVIREGLRIWPPVAGLVPKTCDTEQIVCGKRIPPGTNVCWEARSVLCDKSTFGEDAECFRPDRWLEVTDLDRRRAMDQVQSLAFASGSRWECLGKTVALIELNKVYVELLRRFDFTLVNPANPFKSEDHSLSIQSDLWVRIERRKASNRDHDPPVLDGISKFTVL